MLWNLSHSSSIRKYLHDDESCSIVLYDQDSEELCSGLCGRLLSCGFDLILMAMDPVQQSNLHEHLRSAYPKRNIAFTTAQAVDGDNVIQTFPARLQNISLFVNCIRADSKTGYELSTKEAPSIQTVADLHKAALPHLVNHAPSALVIIANTLSPSLSEVSGYFKSFSAGLSEQLQSHGHGETKVTFMEYFDTKTRTGANLLLCPSPEVLSDSIIRALGRNSTHVIPYWPHELLSWLIWCLMFILPSSFVLKFMPS
ncbi:hypothetical protein ACEPAF_4870 [Sanghuangporus sanghuang]